MYQTVKIDGFRSLLDFEITLHSGLNLLVGPNGSGKSNFITFLDFLSTLTTRGLNAALGVAQGAASVFSQEHFTNNQASLTFHIEGTARPNANYFRKITDIKSVQYNYDCCITYLRATPSVFIQSETLRLVIDGDDRLTINRDTSDLPLEYDPIVTLTPNTHPLFDELQRWRYRDKKPTPTPELRLAQILSPERSIISILASDHPVFEIVAHDLAKYESINIDPMVARKSTAVEAAHQVGKNGDGLAGALYSLERSKYFPRRPALAFYDPRVQPLNQPRLFSEIISWCREVNRDIDTVNVTLDFVNAKIVPMMKFNSGAQYSFERISDGTVKWLSLVTMLFIEPDLSLIEEPENYLHPHMQESFIALCRTVLDEAQDRVLIVSTHSPVVIDCCSPDELIIFESIGGRSRASAIANIEHLRTKLHTSRFGLGYFYRMGALYGARSGAS